MSFDKEKFDKALSSYLDDCVTFEISWYKSQLNPVGTGSKLGYNFDVGETHSYSLKVKNDGPLNMLNVQIEIKAKHGKVSGTYTGFIDLLGSQWSSPWKRSFVARAFNLNAHTEMWHEHEFSRGNLFGYAIHSPTTGSDNNRAVEELLSARIISWQPDLSNYILKPTSGPRAIKESFIQRT